MKNYSFDMKNLFIYILLSSFANSQNLKLLEEKREVFLGVNKDIKFDTSFVGVNAGFTCPVRQVKKMYYQFDIHTHKQYFQNTLGNTLSKSGQGTYYYEDLLINRLTFNNMFSLRFYQKKKNRLYFELGLFLGIDLWQKKIGQYYKWIGAYEYQKENIDKNNFLMPKNTGLHLDLGVCLGQKIIIKPNLRLSLFTFDKVYVGKDNRGLNAVLLANFNLTYSF